ncbi:MAG: hypothetical protein CBD16_05430 [Betaproteobacteria bacterium TMED156]|nr:MAG: hypothetical protein CBD16_05430 [Betaproteobacteria bacterium TMED156]
MNKPEINFLKKCQLLLGETNIKITELHGWDSVKDYSIDWRRKFFGKPMAVCFPSTTTEVQKIIEFAVKDKIKIVPQGGNTGLSGGATPDATQKQVVMCLKRMNKIRNVDSQNRTITLDAGCTLKTLQKYASDLGLFFPLDITSRDSATVGGLLSTNAGGLAVLKYGTTRSMCLGIEFVLPTGEIWCRLQGLRKDNSGYDLKNLFVGSEGTLGIITAATMSLVPKPDNKITALLVAQDLASTISFFCNLQKKFNDGLTAFEFMQDEALKLLEKHFPDLIPTSFKKYRKHIFILLEISSFSTGSNVEDFNESIIFHDFLQDCISNGTLMDGIQSGTEARTKQFWDIRESITYASAKDGPQVKNDLSLPISSIPKFVDKASSKLEKLFPGVRIINFGHLGDGNLHFNIAPPAQLGKGVSDEERQKKFRNYLFENEDKIRRFINDEVISYSGSISAEHGLGQLRKDEAIRIKPAVEIEIMKKIKNCIDPSNTMNPGKVL